MCGGDGLASELDGDAATTDWALVGILKITRAETFHVVSALLNPYNCVNSRVNLKVATSIKLALPVRGEGRNGAWGWR